MKNSINRIYTGLFLLMGFNFAVAAQSLSAPDVDMRKLKDGDKTTSVIVEFGNDAYSLQQLDSIEGEARINVIAGMRTRFLSTLSPNLKSSVARNYQYLPGVVINVNDQQLAELRANQNVKSIYLNKPLRANLSQSIPIVYPNKGAAGLNGQNQMVAVLDTGVHRNHSFFMSNGASRVISEACYSGGNLTQFSEIDPLCPGNATSSTAPGSGEDCVGYDGCDHGTHVAGIAAGNDGVADGANILAVQVFTGLNDLFFQDLCGTGPGTNCVVAYNSDILAGLERVYALRNNYNIAAVNMSLGGGQFFSSCNNENNLITNIVSQLKSAGIATISSSGNDGFDSSMGFPACISNIIAVGATSDFTGDVFGNPVTLDQRTFYSNNSAQLDLYAPGTLINSSVPNNSFENFNGTSMAAPHVAGAFAVIKQGKPQASVNEIESTFKSVGPNVSSFGVTRKRLDIKGALAALGLGNKVVLPPVYMLLDDDQ